MEDAVSRAMAALEAMPFALAIRRDPALFPWIESLHVLAITIVVGAVLMMDLRLLGFAGQNRLVGRVLKDGVRIVWAAFAVALVSGFLLFASSATTYAVNPAFQLKFIAMLIAGVNMALFHLIGLRDAPRWESGATPAAARAAGIVSLCCWVVIVGAGRWIGFIA